MKNNKIINNLMYPVIVLVLVYVLWEIGATLVDSEFVLAKPLLTFEKMFIMLSNNTFWLYFLNTIGRTLMSYIESIIWAFIFAMLSFCFEPLKKILGIFVSIFRALPTLAVVLILVIWFGSDRTPVIISYMIVMPILYSAIINGMEVIDLDVIDMARLDGASKLRLMIFFYLPLSINGCKTVLSSTISMNIKLIVAAEIIAHKLQSLGGLMNEARNYYEIADLLSLTFITVIVALMLEKIFSIIFIQINKKILGI